MSIDAKLDELINAINRLATANETLAQAQLTFIGASDNGPKSAKAAAAPKSEAPKAAPAPTPAPVQEAAPAAAFSVAQVREALVALPREAVPAILTKFGAGKISDLKPEQFADVIAAAKAAAASDADPLL